MEGFVDGLPSSSVRQKTKRARVVQRQTSASGRRIREKRKMPGLERMMSAA